MPKKTALYSVHEQLGAKIVEFGGYLMPVQYESIVDEHKQVRTSVGMFDVSHMGEFLVSGSGAEAFLNHLTVNDVVKLTPGQAQYTVICYPDGGIVDDLLIYKYETHFMMVVNAANIAKDWEWIAERKQGDVTLENRSDGITLLAIQGPDSRDVLQKIVPSDLAQLKFYRFFEGEIVGIPATISRTGYTGELGYEVYIDAERSEHLWENIIDAGRECDLKPVGLGARDTLRLEAGLCLYGNDLDESTNPIEAGLGWITNLHKDDFIGLEALRKVQEEGPERKLVGFEIMGRGIPRHGYPITFSGNEIGIVTSGTQSPMLEKGIGMGYVPPEYVNPGTTFNIKVRNREIPAKVVEMPFYTSQSNF
ncbi:MAG TPA: glycine cleavage system aminomethyltransferase GcvT [bacterium]|nr:glycine cleavage system aminomethyltransferase GcvT [bacterium]